jgi:hypothetical protein
MATTARPPSGAFSTVRTGSRPGGCPRPMRRSWLRRNRLSNPPAHPLRRAGGFCFYGPLPFRGSLKSAHFFGEAPERRPWATKREDRRAAFAGRSKSLSWFLPLLLGYRHCLYSQVSYPTPYPSTDTFSKPNRRESEKPAGTYRENIESEHCGALHPTTARTALGT